MADHQTGDDRLRTTGELAAIGIVLLALGAAFAASMKDSHSLLPVVVFLIIVGAAALLLPLIRQWYEREQTRDEQQPFSWTIPIAILAGLVILLAYGDWSERVVTLLLIGGASAFVGVLIGFLFGIPRVVARPKPDAGADSVRPAFETNTNLEQISDWLTKIIVGVGLVQADEIVERFDRMLRELHSMSYPMALMGSVILFFLVAGFLNGYLWTRLILTRYFFVNESSMRENAELYEGLMSAYLYQPKPEGFKKAIDAFEQYRKRFGAPRHWRIWVYIACAYGQMYEWMKKSEGRKPEELQDVVDKAVKMIQAAGRANNTEALDVLYGTTRGGADNDLTEIYKDSDDVKAALEPARKRAEGKSSAPGSTIE